MKQNANVILLIEVFIITILVMFIVSVDSTEKPIHVIKETYLTKHEETALLDEDRKNPIVPSDLELQKDVLPVNIKKVKGIYVGFDRDSWLQMKLYDNDNHGGLGTVKMEIVDPDITYEYFGEFEEIDTNLYRVATKDDNSVIFSVTDAENIRHIFVYVNGEMVKPLYRIGK